MVEAQFFFELIQVCAFIDQQALNIGHFGKVLQHLGGNHMAEAGVMRAARVNPGSRSNF